MAAVFRWMRELPDPRVLGDLGGGRGLPRPPRRRPAGRPVGITGFCMGGQYALMAACSVPGPRRLRVLVRHAALRRAQRRASRRARSTWRRGSPVRTSGSSARRTRSSRWPTSRSCAASSTAAGKTVRDPTLRRRRARVLQRHAARRLPAGGRRRRLAARRSGSSAGTSAPRLIRLSLAGFVGLNGLAARSQRLRW